MIPYLTSDCQPQLRRCLSFHLVSPAPAVTSTLLFHAIPQPALSQRISSGRAPTHRAGPSSLRAISLPYSTIPRLGHLLLHPVPRL